MKRTLGFQYLMCLDIAFNLRRKFNGALARTYAWDQRLVFTAFILEIYIHISLVQTTILIFLLLSSPDQVLKIFILLH